MCVIQRTLPFFSPLLTGAVKISSMKSTSSSSESEFGLGFETGDSETPISLRSEGFPKKAKGEKKGSVFLRFLFTSTLEASLFQKSNAASLGKVSNAIDAACHNRDI